MPASSPRPFKLPETLPVMVLERLYLLPGGIQPLFIFEERYRRMLEHALNTDRVFAIGDRRRDGSVRPIVTAGLIISAVRATDGTSQLVLQGIHRMRITGWQQEEPFLIATVEPFETDPGPTEKVNELSQEVEALLEQFTLPEIAGNLILLRQLLSQRNDPSFTCDLVASLALRRPAISRALLEERRLLKRLEILIRELKRVTD
ncbi:MAG: LON peptidase substrate-binding domain-containing protein [Verrucomicrobiaceae bacterium]|nr:LON peptidase substrate-binding domain-containing protein [Verrucomicrobiaceae bacterium]